ncbi:hypothetical protein PRZ48_003833 [Zasmidium cellare]|uniref:Uncharacterized protein n=1 Tax=Zasmidium cellare TaxID=395010 RepID=A0ABR0EYD8_ZASCE|nr:hypothetical protein PRZ48_003833 [Zasmidium cellare]
MLQVRAATTHSEPNSLLNINRVTCKQKPPNPSGPRRLNFDHNEAFALLDFTMDSNGSTASKTSPSDSHSETVQVKEQTALHEVDQEQQESGPDTSASHRPLNEGNPGKQPWKFEMKPRPDGIPEHISLTRQEQGDGLWLLTREQRIWVNAMRARHWLATHTPLEREWPEQTPQSEDEPLDDSPILDRKRKATAGLPAVPQPERSQQVGTSTNNTGLNRIIAKINGRCDKMVAHINAERDTLIEEVTDLLGG